MIKQISIRGFDKNFSYFIYNEGNKEIAIVDPGDADQLIAEINIAGWIPKMILLTHSHFDHYEGIYGLLNEFNIPLYMHKNAASHVKVDDCKIITLDEGDEIKIGNLNVQVLYTPGHTDDSICFFENKRLITGDTLFVEACGRADFENSNVEDLYNSLKRIKSLGDDVEIYSGHDYGSKPVSTIAWEKTHNKYLKANNLAEFKELRI
jgi:hydroxyacylglutathione hydrolase